MNLGSRNWVLSAVATEVFVVKAYHFVRVCLQYTIVTNVLQEFSALLGQEKLISHFSTSYSEFKVSENVDCFVFLQRGRCHQHIRSNILPEFVVVQSFLRYDCLREKCPLI